MSEPQQPKHAALIPPVAFQRACGKRSRAGFTKLACLLFAVLLLTACGAPASTPDDTPFRQAIGDYVRTHNMAMKIKEIKEGPLIDGDAARLSASMTHEQLEGPSVTWEFQFARQPDGSWQAVRHQD